MEKIKTVQNQDESGKLVTIPASELAPGTIPVRVQGEDGIRWVPIENISIGPFKHPPFDEDIREIIWQVHETFAEHRRCSFEVWENIFRRDENPLPEIALWYIAAAVYTEFTKDVLSVKRRRDVYACIVTCMTATPETVLHIFKPEVISRVEVERIMTRFYDEWEKLAKPSPV